MLNDGTQDYRDTPDSMILRQEQTTKTRSSPRRTPTLSTSLSAPSDFITIEAAILDFNSNPVLANRPTPVLRRTASGRLFQPYNQVVKAVEMMEPVMTEEEENEVMRRWAAGEDVVERGARRMRVRHGVKRRKSKDSETVERRRLRCESVFGNVCQDESHIHRCHIKGLFELDSSDPNFLSFGSGSLHGQEGILVGGGGADDVWVEIAQE
jgi:hypothetical protein